MIYYDSYFQRSTRNIKQSVNEVLLFLGNVGEFDIFFHRLIT